MNTVFVISAIVNVMEDEVLTNYFSSGVSLLSDEGPKESHHMREEDKSIREDWVEQQAREYLFAKIHEIEQKIGPELEKIEELKRREWLLRRRRKMINMQKKKYKMTLDQYIRRIVLSGLD